MKKLFAILLCVAMVFSMVACGGNNGDNGGSGGDNGGILGGLTGAKLSDKHVNESQKMEMFLEEGETVTPNGELPNNEEDVKGVDQRYYFNEAINAVIQLDEEKMKLYLCKEEYTALMELKNNKNAYELWKHTVGNLTYMPSAGCWYGRPMHLVYAMWYEDQVKAGATLKEIAAMLSYDELVEIYNQYYDKVPLVVEYCGGPEEFYMEDGYIKFEMGSPMLGMGVSDLDRILAEDIYFPEAEDADSIHINNLYELVLGWTAGDYEWDNFDKLYEDGECKLLENFQKKDLDAIIAMIDADEKAWEDDWADDKEDYDKFMKNEAAKAALQKFMNEHVTFYRTHEDVYVVWTVDTNITYGDFDYSFKDEAVEAERALLKSAVYCNIDDAYGDEYLGSEWDNFMGEIIEAAQDHDVFKDIAFDEE